MLYKRFLQEKIESRLFGGMAIILYGPRQSGKTTLVKAIAEKFAPESLYYTCENAEVQDFLVLGRPDIFQRKVGSKRLIILDEAQTVPNIGSILKGIIDAYPEIQIIATGSSSFELANHINEPLTGRAYEYMLYPLSLLELLAHDGSELITEQRLEHCMRFGFYPKIVDANDDIATELVQLLAQNYLYKDILSFEQIKKPRLLDDLLKLLAVSVGSEVSLSNLAKHLEVNKATIERYLDLLEKIFVIKRLYPFSRNQFHEIKQHFKVYFVDIGFRNILVRNVNPLSARTDVGVIFENMFIMERLKNGDNSGILMNRYFWRTYTQQEVDYIEDSAGVLTAFECKWKGGSWNHLNAFQERYPDTRIHMVDSKNIFEKLTT